MNFIDFLRCLEEGSRDNWFYVIMVIIGIGVYSKMPNGDSSYSVYWQALRKKGFEYLLSLIISVLQLEKNVLNSGLARDYHHYEATIGRSSRTDASARGLHLVGQIEQNFKSAKIAKNLRARFVNRSECSTTRYSEKVRAKQVILNSDSSVELSPRKMKCFEQ